MYIWNLFWKIVTAVMLIGLIAWALSGCAAVGYIAGAAGTVRGEMKSQELEERVVALENGDIW